MRRTNVEQGSIWIIYIHWRIEVLYLLSVDGHQVLAGKSAKRANGIACGHVREIGKVLTAEIDGQCATVFFKSIAVAQEEQ